MLADSAKRQGEFVVLAPIAQVARRHYPSPGPLHALVVEHRGALGQEFLKLRRQRHRIDRLQFTDMGPHQVVAHVGDQHSLRRDVARRCRDQAPGDGRLLG